MNRNFIKKHLYQIFRNRMLHALLASFITTSLYAENLQGVFIEALGSSTNVGIHYDTRFAAGSPWGVRVGVAYTNVNNKDFFNSRPDKTKGWTFPLAINYLLGKKKHFCEIGVGFNIGLYTCTYIWNEKERSTDHQTGHFLFMDLGYRYQPYSGILIRAGLNLDTSLSGNSLEMKRPLPVYPYIALGYAL